MRESKWIYIIILQEFVFNIKMKNKTPPVEGALECYVYPYYMGL